MSTVEELRATLAPLLGDVDAAHGADASSVGAAH